MFLISRTGWIKNGIYKGQTLVQWGGGGWFCTATLDPLLQVLHGDFRNFSLIIMCAIGKDSHVFILNSSIPTHGDLSNKPNMDFLCYPISLWSRLEVYVTHNNYLDALYIHSVSPF